MLGNEADDAIDDGEEAADVEAAERVEREVMDDEHLERERPSWSSFLLLGCSKRSSPSASEFEAGSSSSLGQRNPVEFAPRISSC